MFQVLLISRLLSQLTPTIVSARADLVCKEQQATETPMLHSALSWSELVTYTTELLVRNHVKLGVSLRVLYCVVDTGYGLGRSLGDCRPALPED